MMNLRFLKQITFVRTRFEFLPASSASSKDTTPELPPFAGSALRGAFGHAFRRQLCWFAKQRQNPCELADGECSRPADCEYFRLFERSRQDNVTGPNVPKPYILEPPIPPELIAIATGSSPIAPPFFQLPNGPAIANDTPLAVPNGFSVGFTLLGQAASLLTPVTELLCLSPLHIGPHRFVLDRVSEPVTASLGMSPSETASSSVQIAFVTPCRLRASSREGGDYRFDAQEIASAFWQTALIRAMRVRDHFCSDGERLPWIDLPAEMLPRVVRSQLYRYHYERLSNRQRKKMDFDGMIGSVWYEGSGLGELAPLVEAAEVLHIGQKATFGLGLVRADWGGSPRQA